MSATIHASKQRPRVTRTGKRAREAIAILGPLGSLFGSASTARVLRLFTSEPEARFSLGELQRHSGSAKGTLQADLRTLLRAELVRREGHGARTWYRYALEDDMGQEMLVMVRLSERRARHEPKADIPWLAKIAQSRPRAAMEWNPFGDRAEETPSEDAARRVLAASEPTPEAQEPRAMPGLRTRR